MSQITPPSANVFLLWLTLLRFTGGVLRRTGPCGTSAGAFSSRENSHYFYLCSCLFTHPPQDFLSSTRLLSAFQKFAVKNFSNTFGNPKGTYQLAPYLHAVPVQSNTVALEGQLLPTTAAPSEQIISFHLLLFPWRLLLRSLLL